MNTSKKFFGYEAEINHLVGTHAGAILAVYVEAFNDGMRVGKRNALIGASVGAAAGIISLCIAGITYWEHKRNS